MLGVGEGLEGRVYLGGVPGGEVVLVLEGVGKDVSCLALAGLWVKGCGTYVGFGHVGAAFFF